ncbi:hypothetical protein LO762_20325 [Actinocorallia sp. API 0066]|uniref:hypothetical protein n=1 Tax=Actinocorallia sp. API 0066 TaxID=2896846 RepID=UPI001E4787FB|nr:hypothetical protein [Actinocorallia sp. API 0066]MCD0451524.1 hypothetical protein [Actinocorallia sp. API 0066]
MGTQDVLRKARRLLAIDVRGTVSLGLWAVRRKHGVPAGSVAVPYASAGNSLLLVFGFSMVVETIALEAMFRGMEAPPVLGAVSLGLHVWALVAIVSMAAAYATRPHVVTREHVRIRHGAVFDLAVARARIADVRLARSYDEPYGVTFADDVLVLGVSAETNVVLAFTEPVEVTRPLGGTARVSTVRFYADEPRVAVAALRPGAP